MGRQLGVRLLTRITNTASSSANSVSPISAFPSSSLKPNCYPFHPRCSPSDYSSLSPSYLWKICSPSRVAGGIRNGVSPRTFVSRSFFSTALLKVRPQIPRAIRSARFYNSFNSLDRGRRSFFRRFTADGIVLGLIVTNVAVYLLWRVADTQFMKKNFMISVANIKSGHLHTMITSAFSHIDSWHLISNMLGLYFFGTSVGRTFGAEYLLKLYLAGAIGGSVFYLIYHAFIAPSLQGDKINGMFRPEMAGLGASGAVNAIMLLDIFLFPTKTLYLDFIIPVPAILLGIFIIGKDMLRVLEGDPKVSGSAHLGGATVAAIALLRYRKGRFR